MLKKLDGDMSQAFQEWLDAHLGDFIAEAAYDQANRQITLSDTNTPSVIGGYVEKFTIGDETSAKIYVRDPDAVHDDELNGAGKIVTVRAIKDPNENDYGDNYLIEDEGSYYMVDLGNEASYLADYLVSKDITHIDRLIITHYHLDHIGGGSYIGPVYNFLTLFADARLDWDGTVIYLPHSGIDYSQIQDATLRARIQDAENAFNLAAVSAGCQLVYPIEGQQVEFSHRVNVEFHNIGAAYYNNYYSYYIEKDGSLDTNTIYNNFSMLSVFNILGKSAVFFGDAQEKAQELNAEFIQGAYFLAVPHHGQNSYGSHEFCSALNTSYAIVGNRSANAHIGTTETERISAIGGQVYDTFNGEQVFRFTPGSIITEGEPVLFYHADYYAGSAIVENSDLNDYTEPGIYFSPDGVRTATLTNAPQFATSRSFRLDVISTSRTLGAIIQVVTKSNDVHPEIWIRTKTGGGTWSGWMLNGGIIDLSGIVSAAADVTLSRVYCYRQGNMVTFTCEGVTSAGINSGTALVTLTGLSVIDSSCRAYMTDVGSDNTARRYYTVSTGGNVEIRGSSNIASGVTIHINLTFMI